MIFVHAYKYSHEKKRKKYLKLYKAGKVTRKFVKDGWLFEIK